MENYFKQFETGKGIEFMDTRDKGNIRNLTGEELHIDDFGFINGSHGRYVAITFVEHPDEFYFGGTVLTDICGKVEADGKQKELSEQPIKLTMKKSRNGNNYMAVEFL